MRYGDWYQTHICKVRLPTVFWYIEGTTPKICVSYYRAVNTTIEFIIAMIHVQCKSVVAAVTRPPFGQDKIQAFLFLEKQFIVRWLRSCPCAKGGNSLPYFELLFRCGGMSNFYWLIMKLSIIYLVPTCAGHKTLPFLFELWSQTGTVWLLAAILCWRLNEGEDAKKRCQGNCFFQVHICIMFWWLDLISLSFHEWIGWYLVRIARVEDGSSSHCISAKGSVLKSAIFLSLQVRCYQSEAVWRRDMKHKCLNVTCRCLTGVHWQITINLIMV